MITNENANRVMESGNHFKNRASQKSSRKNKKKRIRTIPTLLLCVFVFLTCKFWGCTEREYSIADVTYHICGSEDLLSTYDITLTYSTPTGRVQETVQLPWEKTIENVQFPVSDTIYYKCVRKQDYPQKDSYTIVVGTYFFMKFTELSGEARTVGGQMSDTLFTSEYPPRDSFEGTTTYEISPLSLGKRSR